MAVGSRENVVLRRNPARDLAILNPPANEEAQPHLTPLAKSHAAFCEVFEAELRALRYHEPIYCFIGIAQGSGGELFVLATRYESMRNVVFKNTGEQSSLIFIQDAVYKNLSRELQVNFEHWDCTEKGHRIRDDVHAVHAWFCRMPGAEAAVDKHQAS